jgi:hypothetical protein
MHGSLRGPMAAVQEEKRIHAHVCAHMYDYMVPGALRGRLAAVQEDIHAHVHVCGICVCACM